MAQLGRPPDQPGQAATDAPQGFDPDNPLQLLRLLLAALPGWRSKDEEEAYGRVLVVVHHLLHREENGAAPGTFALKREAWAQENGYLASQVTIYGPEDVEVDYLAVAECDDELLTFSPSPADFLGIEVENWPNRHEVIAALDALRGRPMPDAPQPGGNWGATGEFPVLIQAVQHLVDLCVM